MPKINERDLNHQLARLQLLKQLKDTTDELRRYDESKRTYRAALVARIDRLQASLTELDAMGAAA